MPGEEPDFRIITADGEMGIELRELLPLPRNNWLESPLREQRFHEDIIRGSERQYYANPSALPVKVTAYFWAIEQGKHRTREMTDGLVRFGSGALSRGKPCGNLRLASRPTGRVQRDKHCHTARFFTLVHWGIREHHAGRYPPANCGCGWIKEYASPAISDEPAQRPHLASALQLRGDFARRADTTRHPRLDFPLRLRPCALLLKFEPLRRRTSARVVSATAWRGNGF